jgi:hypothetical protein
LIYHFIGEGDTFDPAKLDAILKGAKIPEDSMEAIVQFLLYYGFIGIRFDSGPTKYIFDVGYDMRLINVLVAKHADTVRYVLNPAFFPGLNL